MKKLKLLLATGAVIAALSVPAQAVTAFGVTYDLLGSGPNFTLHITGINGPADVASADGGGRSGLNAFAFSLDGAINPTGGTSAFGTFQTGGLDSDGCNGKGGFFCFTAVPQSPSTPALPANTTLDIAFTLLGVLDFTTWLAGDGPSIKVDWAGSKIGNYDNVSLAINGTSVNPVPVPGAVWLFGSGIVGLIALNRRRKRLTGLPATA